LRHSDLLVAIGGYEKKRLINSTIHFKYKRAEEKYKSAKEKYKRAKEKYKRVKDKYIHMAATKLGTQCICIYAEYRGYSSRVLVKVLVHFSINIIKGVQVQ
jgi:succinate dehydrogenase/fumarate reductase flavoprotein subunit